MFSFWEYSNLRIGKFFLIKLWTRCCGKWVYVLPHLICTQVYEINTVFISILDKRKIRQGGRVICPISHSPVESGVEHRQSNPKTDTASAEADFCSGTHLVKWFLMICSSWEISWGSNPWREQHLAVRLLSSHVSSLSTWNVLCLVTNMTWQCVNSCC